MRLFRCLAVSVAIHAVAVLGPVVSPLFSSEVPEVYVRPIICIWPPVHVNLEAVFLGATNDAVAAFFDGRGLAESKQAPRGAPWCLRYRYSSGRTLTLLFASQRVRALWLGDFANLPEACRGIYSPLVGERADSRAAAEQCS
jgi:hypothetical protein